MKKILLALPLVASASWAGTSYYAGAQTQDAYHQLLTQLSDYKPLSFDNASYTSGLSHSVAITNVRASTAPDAEILLQLQHEISHSPVGYDDGVRVSAANIVTTVLTDELSDGAQEFFGYFDNGELGRIVTSVNFAGAATSVVNINPLSVYEEGVEFKYTGGEVTTVDNNGHITFKGNVGSLHITDDDGTALSLKDLLVDSNMTRVASGIFTGSSEISTSGVSYTSPLMGEMSVDLVKLSSDTTLSGDNIAGRCNLVASGVNSPVDLDNAEVSFSMEGLSVTAISEYNEVVSQLGISADVPDEQVAKEVIGAFKNMLQPGLSVEYKFAANNSGGKANFSTGFTALASMDSFMRRVSAKQPDLTLRDLLDTLKINLDFYADAKTLQAWNVEAMAQHFVLQPYVISDGTAYRGSIEVKDTLITSNGDAQSLELLVGPMLDQPLRQMLP